MLRCLKTAAMNPPKPSKHLIVFDFDRTIIDENSDTFVDCLCPGGSVPSSVKDVYNGENWTAYMDSLFSYLYKQGVREDHFRQCMARIPLVEGVKELILNLKNKVLTNSTSDEESQEDEPAYEMIIISDSNTFFIQSILEHYGIDTAFRQVFTNVASFDSNGCLRVKEYHNQDYCDLSAVNLCKGRILTDYITQRRSEGVYFGYVSYVGDGRNDLCPGLKLAASDHLFVRKGHSLHKLLQKKPHAQLVANVHYWETGYDIHKKLSIVSGTVPPTPPPSPAFHQGASHPKESPLSKLQSLSPLSSRSQPLLPSGTDD